MITFRRANIITGWIVFLISAIVYLLTKEPTASFWDCGEFIAAAYKLEVGHPPGAPFFMLISRFFSLFASAPEEVAKWINAMSALASAMTIGMLPSLPLDRFCQVGNAAGTGARIALISLSQRYEAQKLASQVQYIELATAASFNETFLRTNYIG